MARKRKNKSKRIDYGEIIKVQEKDLSDKLIDGKRVYAYCWDDGSGLYIQKGARGKQRLRYICHELLHICFPEDSFPDVKESDILRAEKIITDVLWSEGFRKPDNKMF